MNCPLSSLTFGEWGWMTGQNNTSSLSFKATHQRMPISAACCEARKSGGPNLQKAPQPEKAQSPCQWGNWPNIPEQEHSRLWTEKQLWARNSAALSYCPQYFFVQILPKASHMFLFSSLRIISAFSLSFKNIWLCSVFAGTFKIVTSMWNPAKPSISRGRQQVV